MTSPHNALYHSVNFAVSSHHLANFKILIASVVIGLLDISQCLKSQQQQATFRMGQ